MFKVRPAMEMSGSKLSRTRPGSCCKLYHQIIFKSLSTKSGDEIIIIQLWVHQYLRTNCCHTLWDWRRSVIEDQIILVVSCYCQVSPSSYSSLAKHEYYKAGWGRSVLKCLNTKVKKRKKKNLMLNKKAAHNPILFFINNPLQCFRWKFVTVSIS